MKILLIRTENDYEAVDFENVYAKQNVSDLIAKIETGETLVGEAGELPTKVVTVPDVSISHEFIDFIRREVQDYEHTKHTNFYLENTII